MIKIALQMNSLQLYFYSFLSYRQHPWCCGTPNLDEKKFFGQRQTLAHFAALNMSLRANLGPHFRCRISCSTSLYQSPILISPTVKVLQLLKVLKVYLKKGCFCLRVYIEKCWATRCLQILLCFASSGKHLRITRETLEADNSCLSALMARTSHFSLSR